MNKLRIGVAGLGMGKRHVASFHHHPCGQVVAVADLNQSLLAEVARDFEVPHVFTDAAEMVRSVELDVVCVALPNCLHKDVTIQALEANCHVFCEKPMAMNAAEAEEMLTVARKMNRQLGIDFRFRFAPQSRAMKQLIDDGALGEIYYGRTEWLRRLRFPGFGGWFGRKEFSGGGPLIDLGVHRLDLALWLMGYPEVDWVTGSTFSLIGDKLAQQQQKPFNVEDFACGTIHFKNGAVLELAASWAGNIRKLNEISTRILGTKGGVRQYNVGDNYDFEVEYCREVNGMHFDGILHEPVPDCPDACTMFLDALVAEKPFLVNPEEGVKVMRLLDAFYRSAAENCPVYL